jgi:hypothetical protein
MKTNPSYGILVKAKNRAEKSASIYVFEEE